HTMAEQELTLEQAQAATVEAVKDKNVLVAAQKAAVVRLRMGHAAELKTHNKAIRDALATEMKIRRKLAKAEAEQTAEEATAE
ncbi:MAG TPA: hypothetical protein VM238_15840, partial [Phycisphaerae bacterium]|nr:hypothetical protein [Phycisphaerae bacterium]